MPVSNNNMENWQEYENKAYELFCSTGHCWLIECKHLSRPVSKHEVQSLKTVIDDVGETMGT